MKKNGLLIIDEYVGPNRLQYPKKQIQAINNSLQLIPKKYRKIYKTPMYKNRVSGAGLFRMKLADPSECVDSESILPTLRKRFKPVIEHPCGGNVVMYALKDIAHHFKIMDKEKTEILHKVIEIEDKYLAKFNTDYLFGVYAIE